jgi:hypothetical protein
VRIRDSCSLDTGRVREGHTELNSRVQTSMILASHREVQCEKVYNQEKFGKRTKNLSELSDPKSLDGSPTNSETINQAIKARETILTRKQSIPQYATFFLMRSPQRRKTILVTGFIF